MKKNKLTKTERKAAAKRGAKRAERLKKTQKEKHLRVAAVQAEKKAKSKKIKDAIEKLMQSKYAK